MTTEESILQGKIDNMLNGRAAGINSKIDIISGDAKNLVDYMVNLQSHQVRAELAITDAGLQPRFSVKTGDVNLNLEFCKHSVLQISDKLKVQPSFMAQLYMATEEWKKALFVHNVNEYINHTERKDHLIRVIHPEPEELIRMPEMSAMHGQMRAFLSNRYKRYDGFELLAQFIKAGRAYGAEISSIHYDYTRHWCEMIIPKIRYIETENNGVVPMLFGVRMANSDFGDGAYELRGFNMRVECLNGMTTKSILRQIHIGAKLPPGVIVSPETLELNTAAMTSSTKDVIKHMLSDDAITQQTDLIKLSSQKEVSIAHEVKVLPRVGMTKSEADATRAFLMAGNPEDGISGKPTVFKLSQAISRVANETTGRRKMELNDVAGGIIDRVTA